MARSSKASENLVMGRWGAMGTRITRIGWICTDFFLINLKIICENPRYPRSHLNMFTLAKYLMSKLKTLTIYMLTQYVLINKQTL